MAKDDGVKASELTSQKKLGLKKDKKIKNSKLVAQGAGTSAL